ncbi:MAG: TatD family hydrolase [Geobacteraceae bacterium]|nr:TatD family hydrolase [Geobacteraceae bacterium]
MGHNQSSHEAGGTDLSPIEDSVSVEVSAAPPPLFDIHCHCGLSIEGAPPAQPGMYELIATAQVRHWEQLLPQLDAARKRFGALGLHPWYADQWDSSCAARLETLLARPEVLGVGEVGLDPAAGINMQVQEQVLRAQIRMALEFDKPLILHVSKGYSDVLRILKDEKAERVGGVVHGFSAGANIGNAFSRLGFYLGIGPLLLRKNARKLPQALRHLALEHLVLETDAQGGMEGYASSTERTRVLAFIAHRLAELYAISPEQVRRQVWHNSCELLRLDPDPCEEPCKGI